MLKKDITFEDLEGNPVTETHYFHLTKADLIELQLGKQGGFEEWLQRVIAAEDGKELVRALKDIILMAYGVKSEDGKRFIKTETLRAEFANSEAFAELFAEIAMDQDKASAFVNGIIPRGLIEDTSGQQNVFNQDQPQPAEEAVATPPAAAPVEPAPVAQVAPPEAASEAPESD
ncbi:MAG TPA: hypothetical protein PKD12_08120 [Nitrospira sp.]|nr:hypothetical protein [Nitrospira sp.]